MRNSGMSRIIKEKKIMKKEESGGKQIKKEIIK